ncbi:MAG: response regulator [Planctomycetes bacterium]|nr:response regulator [Planctomycetota bacterium]
MVSPLRFTVTAALMLATAPGQVCLADACTARLHELPAASSQAFLVRLELVEALRRCDLGEGLRQAQELWSDANDAGAPAVAAAAAAQAGLLLHSLEGEPACQVWLARAEGGAEGALPEVLADWCLARAGQLCLAGEHADELLLALRAQELSEQQVCGSRQMRAELAIMHNVPLRGELRVRRHLSELRARGDQLLLEVFDAQFRFELLSGAQASLEPKQVEPQLRAIEEAAEKQGNRWLFAGVAGLRAELAHASDDLEQRRHWLEQSHLRLLAYGNQMLACQDADVLAELAVRRGELDEAGRLIEELQGRIDGRGWRHIERNLLVTRHMLAEARGDGESTMRLAAELEVLDSGQAVKAREVAAIRERLHRAEVARAEFEQQLQAERLRFAERAQDTWMYGALVGGSLLLALLGVSWFARGRLQRSNRALAAQFERAEAARVEREALEERVRRIERAEGLGTLAAGVAHDFNNLLTGILGSAELLRDEESAAARSQHVESILASGRQGARLCRQLQVYDADAPAVKAPHDLRAVLREACTMLSAVSSPRLVIDLELGDEPVVADVDRGRFEQVLLNLVQNARESGAGNVHISLARGQLAIDHASAVDGDGPAAVIEVRDDGSGMSPEVAARVFDPYFSTKFPGRGLGLAVAFGCVRRHGGTIDVDSRPGGGTTFRVRLPLREAQVVIPAPPPRAVVEHPRQAMPRVTMLVVDDEPQVRTVLLAMLGRLGLPGQAAAGGEQALAMVAAADPAEPLLMFVDLSMPDMGGAEVCERVRVTRPDARVVLMSGHVAEHFEQVVRQVEPDATLGKPFDLDEVRRVLARLVDDMVSSR